MAVETEEITRVRAHKWQVSALEFRPDGFRLATAGWDREVHIWDLYNLEVLTTLQGVHKVPITSLSWQSPDSDGGLFCTGSADHTAVLWNPETAVAVRTLEHKGWVLGTSFSLSGSALATASWDETIGIWDPNTGQCVGSYTGHTKGVWSVDFHPSSCAILCSGGEDGTVKIWDTREGKVEMDLSSHSGHSGAVYCTKWSPDGTLIASGSTDTKVRQNQCQQGRL